MQLTVYRAAQSSRSHLRDVGYGISRSAKALRSPVGSLKVLCRQIFSSVHHWATARWTHLNCQLEQDLWSSGIGVATIDQAAPRTMADQSGWLLDPFRLKY